MSSFRFTSDIPSISLFVHFSTVGRMCSISIYVLFHSLSTNLSVLQPLNSLIMISSGLCPTIEHVQKHSSPVLDFALSGSLSKPLLASDSHRKLHSISNYHPISAPRDPTDSTTCKPTRTRTFARTCPLLRGRLTSQYSSRQWFHLNRSYRGFLSTTTDIGMALIIDDV